MKITLNNHFMELNEFIYLDNLISKQIGVNMDNIAVSVNKQIIPHHNWSIYQIKDGDDILLFQAITGG
ncbi:MAG: sulfur carrier protein ThiS (plasmid) [Pantoea sp. Brub]|nr:sulfur carrier protein ThiS [Pantoea sp. Brub]